MPIPRAALADRFGSDVADRLDQAFGDRPEPVSPLTPASPWHVRISFAEPVGRMEDVADSVRNLAGELADMLEAEDTEDADIVDLAARLRDTLQRMI